MQDFENTFKKILKLVAADWEREIKENFRTQSYDGSAWPGKTNYPGSRSKQLYKDGDLQDSLKVTESVSAGTITARSHVRYASIHNEGGRITVTAKMKAFFWVMHRMANGAAGQANAPARRRSTMSTEAAYWKALALMKVGQQIKIPQRQFVGFSHQLDEAIIKRTNQVIPPELDAYMKSVLQKK
mgnify:CR=1 FL=1